MHRRPTKNSKAIQATLEFSFLHGGPFSQHLLDSVLLNFVDELEESATFSRRTPKADAHQIRMKPGGKSKAMG